MAQSKWVVVLVAAAVTKTAVADSLGVNFLDAGIYRQLQKANQPPRNFNEWFAANFSKRMTFTGQQNIGVHLDQVSGDVSAYDETTNFGEGNQTVTDFGQVNVAGNKVLGLFNFNFAYADSHYLDPSSRRFALNYERKNWHIDAGNITATLLGGNQFMSFSRQLNGVSVGYTSGAFSIKGLASQSKSTATTVSLSGLNTPGPYYLQASEIIADSVRVQVDGKEMNYPDDFTVDTVIGSITFNTLSVPSTSTILVSFESQAVNGGTGTVAGLGVLYHLGKFGSIGGAMIEQTDPTSSLSTYVDRFQGFGDPSTPYILQYTPLASRPIVVALDGVTQVANVDYQFSPSNPTVFYFLRYIPTTSTITVTYTPSPTSTLSGNRQVEGFNYSYPFGKNGKDGAVTYSQAFSHLSNPVDPLSGTARGVTAEYRLKHFDFTGSFDDVPNTFVGIQSTGFLRNERATTLGTQYKAGRLTLDFKGSNSDISSQATDSNGNIVFVPGRNTNLEAGAKYRGNDGLTWSLDQQHLTSWSIDGEATAEETSFSLAKAIGRLNSHFTLGHTQGYGPITTALSTVDGNVRLDSIGWNGDYAASHGWTIGGRATLSAVDTAGTNATGTDASASIAYRKAGNPFGFDTSYAYSNSGEIATLGAFQDGSGLGYNGNGFTASALPTAAGNASVGSTTFNSTGTDLQKWQTTANWTLAKRVSLGANYLISSQFGAISTNSTTTEYGLSMDYDLQNGQRMGLALDQSDTNFSDAGGTADSLSLDFFVGGRPKGPWSYRLAVGGLLTSGGTIAQNSFHYSASLLHYFKTNQAVGLEIASTSLTNYEPQDDFLIAASYQYKIFKNVGLVVKYQVHSVTNLDPTVTTGAYNSHGLDLNVNFNFGS